MLSWVRKEGGGGKGESGDRRTRTEKQVRLFVVLSR